MQTLKTGKQSRQTFSLADFKNELKRCGKYALLQGSFLTEFVFANADAIKDHDDYSKLITFFFQKVSII